MSQTLSNMQLLLLLAGWISVTSARHHRKPGAALDAWWVTGFWGGLTATGRRELLLGVLLMLTGIFIR